MATLSLSKVYLENLTVAQLDNEFPTFKKRKYSLPCSQKSFTELLVYRIAYICIAGLHPKKSPSFCMATFSTSLTNLTVPLPQSRDCSCYVSRPILAPPPLCCRNTMIYAHSPDLWYQTSLANVTCAWNWKLCGTTPTITDTGLIKMMMIMMTVES